MFAIVDRAEEGPRLQLEYNPRYFKISNIERYLRMFVELLSSAVSAPDTRVDQLALIPSAEHAKLLTSWNDTSIDFGPFESVPATFLRRAELDPNGIALECAGTTWTNAQLAAYARTLAAKLIEQGLTPALSAASRSSVRPEMLGAVLAVMIAGAAYVPLDPRHPKERLEAVLEDAGATLLLTSRDLGLRTQAKVIRVDHIAQSPATTHLPAPQQPKTSPTSSTPPARPASPKASPYSTRP